MLVGQGVLDLAEPELGLHVENVAAAPSHRASSRVPEQVGREFYPGALSQIVEQAPGVGRRELEDRAAFPTVQPELEDRHGLLAADEERRALPVPALAGEVHQTLLPAHVLDAGRRGSLLPVAQQLRNPEPRAV